MQWLGSLATKGQLISKAIYGLLTSPKKRTDEFVLFAFLLFTANKSNSYIQFLGESMARQSAIGFIWPLVAELFGPGARGQSPFTILENTLEPSWKKKLWYKL